MGIRTDRKQIEKLFLEIVKAQKLDDSNAEEKARVNLDSIIFKILGLKQNEIEEIYRSLNELKDMRENRAEAKVMIK